MMRKGYIPRRPTNRIIETFEEKGLTSVDAFVDQNFREYTPADENVIPLDTIAKREFLEYTKDKGDGRISRGLKSLEAITKTLKVKNHTDSVMLFNYEIFSNPYEFERLALQDCVQLVIENLGMAAFTVQAEGMTEVKLLKQLSLQMAKEVRDGSFTMNAHAKTVLRLCRTIVKKVSRNV